ncbi:MAG TPA: tetratricopeptide repeat protein [Candidatus Angelobacter sp.]|nr:tetratricopeptide repeat protein [Candidatus Angelobacter sp.]
MAMIPRRFLALCIVAVTLLAASTHAFAQDDEDNQPNIRPRREERQQPVARPSPTPAAVPSPSPGPPQAAQPANAEPGYSSSKDSQIDFSAGPPPSHPDLAARPTVNYDPHRAEKDIEVGNYYLKRKNYRAALERFQDALLYKPNDAEATYGLATTQEKMDLFSLAYNNYSKYLEILPEGPRARESDEGMKRVEDHLPPEFVKSSTGRMAAEDLADGEKYLALNAYDAARQSFERALRLTPDNPAISFRLGQSLEGLEQLDSARMYYRKYLELQPHGPFAGVAKKNIDRINDTIGK